MLKAPGREHKTPHLVFGATVINNVVRAELSKGEKARPRDVLSSLASRHISTQRKAREVVTWEESFAGEISVRIKVRLLLGFRQIAEQVELS